MSKKFKIIDCTLRDGGYYNKWDFDLGLVGNVVGALEHAGVDIVELGYKARPGQSWCGLFRYCNEAYLSFLQAHKDIEIAFMIDVKEYLDSGKINYKELDKTIQCAEESVFSWSRLATIAQYAQYIPELVGYLHDRGYKVSFNLMGVSLLDEDEQDHCFDLASQAQADVFYIADSFGCMHPVDIERIVKRIRDRFVGDIGLHAHENQGMAFANSLAAINAGVTYIDATITGMGRGAGNLQLEQFLLWAAEHHDDTSYQANELLGVIEGYFQPQKERHRWGHNYVYMLSGLKNIHPGYCMSISEGNKFSISQVSKVLDAIPVESRYQFCKDSLDRAVNDTLAKGQAEEHVSFPLFDTKGYQAKREECLVIAPGKHVQLYKFAIDQFRHSHELPIMECNYSGVLEDDEPRLLVIFNEMRLKDTLSTKHYSDAVIVTGVNSAVLPQNKTVVHHFPYEIGPLNISHEELQIPDFEAGEYAISLAVLLGYKKIYLAGFSGYGDLVRDEPMDRFLQQLSRLYPKVEVVSITPTLYQNVNQTSVFAL